MRIIIVEGGKRPYEAELEHITNYSTVTNFNELPLALTVLEAGQVLRVGRNVAYDLVRSGQLRSVRVGKNIRIPRDALAEYLNLAS